MGNQALEHYQETYVDSGVDGTPFVANPGNFHLFGPTADTTDCFGEGSQIANFVFLSPGQTVSIFLTWDDTFGATTTDYDLYLIQNDNGVVVGVSIEDNIGVTGEPTEFIAFTSFGFKFYDIFIQNFDNASALKTFDMFTFTDTTLCGATMNYNTVSSSVLAQGDAGGGVVSAGAISANDPGTNDIESFSSRGPTNNGVIKPDVAAVDGVSVTVSGGFPVPFFGTSAAAPHVAGLAPLLLQLNPELLSGEPGDDPAADRAALRAAIVDIAVNLGIAGPDNTFGSGRVNGLPAAQAVLPVADLSITKSDSPDSAPLDGSLTYTLTVTNNGPDGVPSVVVADTLPGGVSFVSATPSQGSCSESSGTVTCTLGTLANGATATVTIVVTATAPGTLSNTAVVSVLTSIIDPDTTNDSATESTTVLPPPPVPTLTQWGVIVLAVAAALVLAVGAALQSKRRHPS